MSLKRLASLVSSLALATASPIAYAQSASTDPTADVISENCAELAEGATPTDLAQEIAQLEVQLVLAEVRFKNDHPVLVSLKAEQLDLETCYTQLQPDHDPELITAAAVSAIELKITELEGQYAIDQAIYTDDHPGQQLRRLEIEALRQRLATIM